VDILAIEGRDEGLVELGEEIVSDLVAFVLDSLDALDLFGYAGVVREHFHERFGAVMDVLGLLREKVEETLFTRKNPLQKSIHGV
jgi:hypothetical protein